MERATRIVIDIRDGVPMERLGGWQGSDFEPSTLTDDLVCHGCGHCWPTRRFR